MLDDMERRGPFIPTRADGHTQHTAKDDKALLTAFRARACGIGALEFRDLRGATVVMLGAAGLEAPQIASVTGHTMKSALDILERDGARNQAVARAGDGVCKPPANHALFEVRGQVRSVTIPVA